VLFGDMYWVMDQKVPALIHYEQAAALDPTHKDAVIRATVARAGQ